MRPLRDIHRLIDDSWDQFLCIHLDFHVLYPRLSSVVGVDVAIVILAILASQHLSPP